MVAIPVNVLMVIAGILSVVYVLVSCTLTIMCDQIWEILNIVFIYSIAGKFVDWPQSTLK